MRLIPKRPREESNHGATLEKHPATAKQGVRSAHVILVGHIAMRILDANRCGCHTVRWAGAALIPVVAPVGSSGTTEDMGNAGEEGTARAGEGGSPLALLG